MEYSAIFHDMDKRFCYAIAKDLFVIRVQVKKDDIKDIILHYEDKYIPIERKDTRKTIPMKKVATSQFHDYYEAEIQMHLICLRYFFEFTLENIFPVVSALTLLTQKKNGKPTLP